MQKVRVPTHVMSVKGMLMTILMLHDMVKEMIIKGVLIFLLDLAQQSNRLWRVVAFAKILNNIIN
jgi:hypothetical protein